MIVFYNGFNLALDLMIAFMAYQIGKAVAKRK